MSAKTYHITLNGKVYEVEIEEVQAGQAPKQTAAPAVTQAPKAAPAGGAGEEVTAPMPGSMFNILVKEGQAVKKGDVVAVLEAMKMENEIVAPVDGQIVSINVDKGQNVNLGDVILKIA
ncbi:biotin/lipoyl-binding protein [Romboutsia weinsteinii]|uniref:Biotin/lipoyl-binding protein n=1 Tax=Romboutsia weinsteinii TaxID=2020949 RepID=A0A371IZS3_9FIRM|nr:biotin/lipoyl-containing protein [Romboutsia weinsteinii]RDY26009.1 biotin/lipoyl-binding protein [Romboutsia weinsteinii]